MISNIKYCFTRELKVLKVSKGGVETFQCKFIFIFPGSLVLKNVKKKLEKVLYLEDWRKNHEIHENFQELELAI